MSINNQQQHYHSQLQWWSSANNTSSSPNHPSTFCQLSPTNNHLHRNVAVSRFDLNNDDEDGEEEEMARLFEKSLTPSDVGKLNRLVIPKQHAEKHFPLNGGAPEPGENGLLLGFEDENGKPWRFRYSYWNSSQSYVLTKGWSRFVKEKKLDAGDIVVFSRHRVDTRRLLIGWRRRDEMHDGVAFSQPPPPAVTNGGGWGRVFYPGQYAYPSQHLQAGPISSVIPYQSESIYAGTIVQQQQQQQQKGNSKRLRLFGVNLECYDESEPSTPLGSPMSSQVEAQHPYHHHHHHHHQYYSNNHMDIGADVYRQG